jgi:propionyl-CoA carboxylase alpha chain
MIAKVIAHGATREQASRRLADSMSRAELHGITTNRDFLVRVLRHPEFADGAADTSFLDRHDPSQLARPLMDGAGERAAAAAAALALQAGRRGTARALGSLPSGWRNVPAMPQHAAFEPPGGEELTVGYRFARGGLLALIEVNGVELEAPRLHACAADRVDIEIAGRRQRYRVHVDGQAVHVNTPTEQLTLRLLPRLPSVEQTGEAGSLAAPMPGAVLRVMTSVGERVSAGQALLVIEAMKMEHEIVAPDGGVVSDLKVSEGSQVQAGTVLAVIENEEDE